MGRRIRPAQPRDALSFTIIGVAGNVKTTGSTLRRYLLPAVRCPSSSPSQLQPATTSSLAGDMRIARRAAVEVTGRQMLITAGVDG